MTKTHSSLNKPVVEGKISKMYTDDEGKKRLPAPKEVNMSYPSEMIPYIDRLMAIPEIRDLGLDSRRKLTMTLIGILKERIEALPKALRQKIELQINNVSLPEQYPNFADEVSEMRIARILWLGYKTQILSAMLRSLLYKTDPEYAKFVNLLDVSIEDIKRYVSEKGRRTQKAKSKDAKA